VFQAHNGVNLSWQRWSSDKHSQWFNDNISSTIASNHLFVVTTAIYYYKFTMTVSMNLTTLLATTIYLSLFVFFNSKIIYLTFDFLNFQNDLGRYFCPCTRWYVIMICLQPSFYNLYYKNINKSIKYIDACHACVRVLRVIPKTHENN
jgi:hypothetical protein